MYLSGGIVKTRLVRKLDKKRNKFFVSDIGYFGSASSVSICS